MLCVAPGCVHRNLPTVWWSETPDTPWPHPHALVLFLSKIPGVRSHHRYSPGVRTMRLLFLHSQAAVRTQTFDPQSCMPTNCFPAAWTGVWPLAWYKKTQNGFMTPFLVIWHRDRRERLKSSRVLVKSNEGNICFFSRCPYFSVNTFGGEGVILCITE